MMRNKLGLGVVAALAALLAASGCDDGESDGPASNAGGGGAGGEGGTGGATAGADTLGERVLLDDCEDGDNRTLLGGLWASYNDSHDPAVGESEVWPASWFEGGEFTMSEPGYGDSRYAARFKGTTATKLGWDYVGLLLGLGPNSFCPDPQPAEFNLATYEGMRFMAKGTVEGGPLVVKILHSKDGEADNCQDNGLTGDSLTGWSDYAADITSRVSGEWSEIVLDFRKDFSGGASVDIETVLAHAKDIHFFFQTTQGGNVDLTVDDIELYGGGFEPAPPPEVPDMPIREPAPPADKDIESVEIDNPLQALAMQSLDKGYNITNWLEQYPFDGFGDYDEAFVERLAAAGFESLRLPIDLDRFILDFARSRHTDAESCRILGCASRSKASVASSIG